MGAQHKPAVFVISAQLLRIWKGRYSRGGTEPELVRIRVNMQLLILGIDPNKTMEWIKDKETGDLYIWNLPY